MDSENRVTAVSVEGVGGLREKGEGIKQTNKQTKKIYIYIIDTDIPSLANDLHLLDHDSVSRGQVTKFNKIVAEVSWHISQACRERANSLRKQTLWFLIAFSFPLAGMQTQWLELQHPY